MNATSVESGAVENEDARTGREKPVEARVAFWQYRSIGGGRRERKLGSLPCLTSEAAKAAVTLTAAHGIQWEAEVLSTGDVSLTAAQRGEDNEWDDIACEIASNDASVETGVEALVLRVARRFGMEWSVQP